jgi:hypothetical protein
MPIVVLAPEMSLEGRWGEMKRCTIKISVGTHMAKADQVCETLEKYNIPGSNIHSCYKARRADEWLVRLDSVEQVQDLLSRAPTMMCGSNRWYLSRVDHTNVILRIHWAYEWCQFTLIEEVLEP